VTNSGCFDTFSEKEIRPTEFSEEQQKVLLEDISMLHSRKNEFIQISCPACDSKENEFQFSKNDFNYVLCSTCQTTFMNPRPSNNVLKWFYKNSKNYKFWNDVIYPSTEKGRIKNIILPRVNETLELCKKYHVITDSILEIGAGFGSYCNELQSKGIFNRIVAVEPTPNLASTCRKKGIEVIQLPIEEIELSPNTKFNVIVNFEVIEHLFSPKEFLFQINPMLKEKGLLIFSCPNGKGFDVNLLKTKSKTIDHEHLNYFNPQSISILLNSCGFKLLQVFTPGQLDAELVRNKILSNEFELDDDDFFLKHILIDNWNELGNSFQNFLIENSLSSNMWVVAQKTILDVI